MKHIRLCNVLILTFAYLISVNDAARAEAKHATTADRSTPSSTELKMEYYEKKLHAMEIKFASLDSELQLLKALLMDRDPAISKSLGRTDAEEGASSIGQEDRQQKDSAATAEKRNPVNQKQMPTEAQGRRKTQQKQVGRKPPAVHEETNTLEELIEATYHPTEWKVRWDGVNALGNLKDRRGIEPLVKRALYDDNPHPRWRSLWAIYSVDREGDDAIPLLLEGLESSNDKTTVRNAAVALSMYSHDAAVDDLLSGLKDNDEYRRWEAVFCLRRYKGSQIRDLFLGMLSPRNEKSSRVRAEIALSLKGFSNDDGTGVVISALTDSMKNDPEGEVRWRAASSLSRLLDNGEALQLLKSRHGEEKNNKVVGYFEQTIRDLERDAEDQQG